MQAPPNCAALTVVCHGPPPMRAGQMTPTNVFATLEQLREPSVSATPAESVTQFSTAQSEEGMSINPLNDVRKVYLTSSPWPQTRTTPLVLKCARQSMAGHGPPGHFGEVTSRLRMGGTPEAATGIVPGVVTPHEFLLDSVPWRGGGVVMPVCLDVMGFFERHGVFSPTVLTHLAAAMQAALGFMAAHGLRHGDIKPENVLIHKECSLMAGADPNPPTLSAALDSGVASFRLCDFDLTHSTENVVGHKGSFAALASYPALPAVGLTTANVGTLYYTPPEIMMGPLPVSADALLYGLQPPVRRTLANGRAVVEVTTGCTFHFRVLYDEQRPGPVKPARPNCKPRDIAIDKQRVVIENAPINGLYDGPAADAWSLGATLYALHTGKQITSDRIYQECVSQASAAPGVVTWHEFADLAQSAPELLAFATACLSVDAARRPRFWEALPAVQHAVPHVQPREHNQATKRRRPRQRRQQRAIGA